MPNVALVAKYSIPFDILDLPGTIARHREYLSRRPSDAVAHANLVMALDLADNIPTEKAQAERKRWYEAHVQKVARPAVSPHANLRDPNRKIKIGYMSADCRQHSAMYAVAPVIGYHDRNLFHVSVYSSTRPQDHYTAAIRGSADRFYDVHGWSDAQLAYLIEADHIDILVDCSGHTAGFRLETLARKPAPIQLTAFGYPIGTGMSQVDYVVSDAIHIPEGERKHFPEKILEMPISMTYQAPPYAPAVGPLPGLDNTFTFGVLNRVEKISDAALSAWAKIMEKVPSRILIKDRHLSDRDTRRALIKRLKRAGIKDSAIVLRGVTPHLGHMETFHEVDVQLDTYPQTGGISTAEALYMGVPVITMRGRVPASRVTTAILDIIGHREWVAENTAEYVDKAIALASDLEKLSEIRAKLRSDLVTTPFGSPQVYTVIFETKLRELWRAYCEKQ
jgi:protein O-GlcNAc transferase